MYGQIYWRKIFFDFICSKSHVDYVYKRVSQQPDVSRCSWRDALHNNQHFPALRLFARVLLWEPHEGNETLPPLGSRHKKLLVEFALAWRGRRGGLIRKDERAKLARRRQSERCILHGCVFTFNAAVVPLHQTAFLCFSNDPSLMTVETQTLAP